MKLKAVWWTVFAAAALLVFAAWSPSVVLADDLNFDEEGGDDMNFDGGDDGGGMDFDGGDGGGDMDFDGGAEPAPLQQYVIDQNSPTWTTMQQANELSGAGKFYQASLLYHQVLTATDDTAKGLAGQAHYELGRTLFQLGFFQSALGQFNKILQMGPASEHFLPTLQWLALIAREMPGDPERATRIYENYLNMFPVQIEPALLPEVGLLMGQAAYKLGKLDDAIFFLGHVDTSSPLYGKARFLEGVTNVRKFQGEAAVESFKDILRWSQEAPQATREMQRVQELAIAALGRVFYQVGHNLWAQENREKAVGSWNTAIKYYGTFEQASPHWLDSLFEASWTYYRVDNFNKALGLLHTLNSPFFNDEYYPEAMLLQAQIYYTNCHYDRVMYILEEFNAVYPPLKEKLESQLVNLLAPEDVYKFLVSTIEGEGSFDPTTKQVLNAALEDRELRRMLNYIHELDAEVEAINGAAKGWSDQPLAKQLVQDIEFTKQFASAEAGSAAKARLERVVDELKDLTKQARFIEIETTEKLGEAAKAKGLDPTAVTAFEREINAMMEADDEHLFWTFDGEYWRDELGYYWYYLNSRCGR